jgi:hypothetical protein
MYFNLKLSQYYKKLKEMLKTNRICQFCNKQFSRSDACTRHTKTCKIKPIKEELINQSQVQLEEKSKALEKIEKIEKVLEEKDREIQSKDEQITFLKGIIEYQLSKPNVNNYKTIINSTQKNTNKNSNNINIKNVHIKQVLEKMETVDYNEVTNHLHLFTEKYIDQGPKGYANFLCQHPYKEKFITTDNARNILSYKIKNKEVIRDPDGELLINNSLKKNADVIIEKLKDRKNYWKEQIDDDVVDEHPEEIKSISNLIHITNGVKNEKIIKSSDMINIMKKNGFKTIQKFIQEDNSDSDIEDIEVDDLGETEEEELIIE